MATPLETIKIGIQQENWNLVIEGFKNLTGETVNKIRGLQANDILADDNHQLDIENLPKKRGRPKKSLPLTIETSSTPKKRGRPKKTEKQPVQQNALNQHRPNNSTQVVNNKSAENRESIEARTQKVITGKIPQFVNI